MITEQQAEELKEQIFQNYVKLRQYHIQQLLDMHKLTAGRRIKLNGKTYQLLDFDKMCEYNDLRSFYPDLYGRMVRVNGELSKIAYRLYICRSSDVEIVG